VIPLQKTAERFSYKYVKLLIRDRDIVLAVTFLISSLIFFLVVLVTQTNSNFISSRTLMIGYWLFLFDIMLSIAFLYRIIRQFNPKIIITKISKITTRSIRRKLRNINEDEIKEVLPNFNDIHDIANRLIKYKDYDSFRFALVHIHINLKHYYQKIQIENLIIDRVSDSISQNHVQYYNESKDDWNFLEICIFSNGVIAAHTIENTTSKTVGDHLTAKLYFENLSYILKDQLERKNLNGILQALRTSYTISNKMFDTKIFIPQLQFLPELIGNLAKTESNVFYAQILNYSYQIIIRCCANCSQEEGLAYRNMELIPLISLFYQVLRKFPSSFIEEMHDSWIIKMKYQSFPHFILEFMGRRDQSKNQFRLNLEVVISFQDAFWSNFTHHDSDTNTQESYLNRFFSITLVSTLMIKNDTPKASYSEERQISHLTSENAQKKLIENNIIRWLSLMLGQNSEISNCRANFIISVIVENVARSEGEEAQKYRELLKKIVSTIIHYKYPLCGVLRSKIEDMEDLGADFSNIPVTIFSEKAIESTKEAIDISIAQFLQNKDYLKNLYPI
jgi:hypothetical protein